MTWVWSCRRCRIGSNRTVTSAADLAPRVADVLRQRPALLATDFDGTLSPIVPDPALAQLLPSMRPLLRRLRQQVACVAVVTGRAVQDVRRRVRVGGLTYVGNHGLQTWQGRRATIDPQAEPLLPAVRRTVDRLNKTVQIPGTFMEDKGVTASLHYRNAPDPEDARQRILDCIRASVDWSALHVEEGRMVVNLLPNVAVNKGTALDRLVEQVAPNGVVMLGDDLTDTHAFRAVQTLRERESVAALAVAVVSDETPDAVWGAADVAIRGVGEAAELLARVAELLDHR